MTRVVVTGMSGAGRTTCLKMLEDLGYEAVDNLPVNLLGRLVRDGADAPERLARTGDRWSTALADKQSLERVLEAPGTRR